MRRVQFGKGPDFAEVAEALGVPTDHIMSATTQQGETLVMFTPSLEGDEQPVSPAYLREPPVYRAYLRRDDDGILVKTGEPEVVEGFYERFRALMEGRLRPPESGGGGT